MRALTMRYKLSLRGRKPVAISNPKKMRLLRRFTPRNDRVSRSDKILTIAINERQVPSQIPP
jgi:hypothetical protein